MQISKHILSLCTAASVLLASACGQNSRYLKIEGMAQGGTYSIVFKSPSFTNPEEIRIAVDGLLSEIDNSLSGYKRNSLLSGLNEGEDIPLDRHFICNFNISLKVWKESGGAFDPSAAPLFDLWGFGFRDGGEVTKREVDSVLSFVGMDKFSLDTLKDGSVHLRKQDPRCRLNFNALAQGYSCDAIGALLESFGCRDYLVELGGEILCKGKNGRGEVWSIGIEDPEAVLRPDGKDSLPAGGQRAVRMKDTLRLSDCAVVTSGNYRKFNEKGGRALGHIIDPRSGMPSEEIQRSETVIVPCAEYEFPCALADARATVKCLKGTSVPTP